MGSDVVGDAVGFEVVGDEVGDVVGSDVVGEIVGEVVGSEVVGDVVGDVVGSEVVGEPEGDVVGSDVVGEVVGEVVGSEVVGEAVSTGAGSEVAYTLRLRRLLPEEHCQIPVPYPQTKVVPAAELSAAMLAWEHPSMPPELHAKLVPSAELIRLAQSESQP